MGAQHSPPRVRVERPAPPLPPGDPFLSPASPCEAGPPMPEHRLHARCGCASAGSLERLPAAAPAPPLPPSTSPRHCERARPFAVDHRALDVTLEVATRSLRATALLDVRRVD